MEALISLTIFGLILIYTEVFKTKKFYQTAIALLGVVTTAVLTFMNWNDAATYFNKMSIVNNYAIAFNGAMLLGLLLLILAGSYYYKDVKEHVGELYGLMFFSVLGGYLITGYTNMIMLYIGIETLSIPLYVLAGSKKFSYRSNEASMKYFVLGSFASAILLLGITLVYGASGSFNLEDVYVYSQSAATIPSIYQVGIILILVGFLFKVAAMPFHFWAPDVYDGSPTLITAFMATIVKVAAFAAFFTLFALIFQSSFGVWSKVLWVVTALTLVFSNTIALNQLSIKRLLAYASISSTGFLLLAIISRSNISASAILYYLVTYTLAAIPAFTVTLILRKENGENDTFHAFSGLVKRNKLMAYSFAIAILSLAGIPITGGFFAKYYIFLDAINAGFIVLTIVAIAAAAMGIFYFVRLLSYVFMMDTTESSIKINGATQLALVVASFLTLVLGIFPNLILGLI